MNDRTFDRISRGLATTTSRRQALKFLGAGIAGGALVTAGFATGAAKPAVAAIGLPATGTGDAGQVFEGTFTLTNVQPQGGGLVGVGTLTGTLTDASGGLLGSVTALPLQLPLSATGSCDILHLELGPLDLDLLGLVVHLDQIVLDIDAESGPGNLLGNLLCSVAGLLDGNGLALGQLSNLLNQILGILGGL